MAKDKYSSESHPLKRSADGNYSTGSNSPLQIQEVEPSSEALEHEASCGFFTSVYNLFASCGTSCLEACKTDDDDNGFSKSERYRSFSAHGL